MVKGTCRVWWPKQLFSFKPNSSLLLFGWYMNSAFDSLDIVVAFGATLHGFSLSSLQSDLQEVLCCSNRRMPTSLQGHSTFSFLGHCAIDCSGRSINMDSQNTEYQHCDQILSGDVAFVENCGNWNCGCHKLDSFLEKYRQSLVRNGYWIQLFSDLNSYSKTTSWIPKLHHMHQNGQVVPINLIHLVIYERPTFGFHHFSLSSWNYLEQAENPLKKPSWVIELEKNKPDLDLDTIILALNCSAAAKELFERCLGTKSPHNEFPTISRLMTVLWHVVALFVASFCTLFYIILQLCHRLLVYGSHSSFYIILTKLFKHTWENVHIRSCQILYWPIFLQVGGSSSPSNVEYAHRYVLRKHAMWSSVVIDVILGNFICLALLRRIGDVFFWTSQVAHNITNEVLRSGCVWLMGVPAGFKLNTELAELLGIISLNAIQIWSTLWFFIGFCFMYFISGLVLSGSFMGLTVPAALCIDLLKLATLHISTLHWLISFVYSRQIQALASLWRLFRGRKWNPLRQRLDSYDYTVEQHVVGSLIFTPLLLLLPTTSVFYMFFTITNSVTCSICFVIEVTISILHVTPYAEICLWMVRRRRFPSGVWFDTRFGPTAKSSFLQCSSGSYSPYDLDPMNRGHNDVRGPKSVVSVLHNNCANIGQVMGPPYRILFHGFFLSTGSSAIYGILSGRRMRSTLQTGLLPTMPWMDIGFKEYWKLCHSSVLACRS